MHNLLYNISQVLGITIVHSLWQGLIIFIALRLFLLVMPATSSAVKYRVSYAALTLMLGWFVITLFKELGQYDWLSTEALKISPLALPLPALIHESNAPAKQLYFTIAQFMPYLTMLYVVGLVFNTLRLTLAWNSIYRIRQNISNAGFENTVKRLSAKLTIGKTVQAAFSEWVTVPCITGFIKPIILLPVSITCYLSTDEIEAILIHELAHIKRNDYLFNFIQQVIGILLFFNPFARLVGKLINEERENCCDDIVVRVTGSPFLYAQALLKLEENKQHQWQLALAATGKKYELLNRIERIMKTKTHTVNIRPVLITVLALTCSITSIAWLNPEIKNGKVIIKNAPAIRKITAAITGPAEVPAITEVVAITETPKHKKHLSIKFCDDTTKLAKLNDTTIKNKKFKIVIEDENGVKKEYNSLSDLPDDDRAELVGKNADMNYAMAMDSARWQMHKLYNSDVWKKQTAEIQKQALAMARKFNSPEWKKQQKLLVDHSLAMVKAMNGKEFKKQQEALARVDDNIAKQFKSKAWKEQIENMAKAGADMGKYFQGDDWKKNLEGIQKQAEEMGKYYESPEGKKYLEGLAKSAEDMAKYYDSDEWKQKMDNLADTADADNTMNYTPATKKSLKLKQYRSGKKIVGKEIVEPAKPAAPAPKPKAPAKPDAPDTPSDGKPL